MYLVPVEAIYEPISASLTLVEMLAILYAFAPLIRGPAVLQTTSTFVMVTLIKYNNI